MVPRSDWANIEPTPMTSATTDRTAMRRVKLTMLLLPYGFDPKT
jgi:hypothetical protein